MPFLDSLLVHLRPSLRKARLLPKPKVPQLPLLKVRRKRRRQERKKRKALLRRRTSLLLSLPPNRNKLPSRRLLRNAMPPQGKANPPRTLQPLLPRSRRLSASKRARRVARVMTTIAERTGTPLSLPLSTE